MSVEVLCRYSTGFGGEVYETVRYFPAGTKVEELLSGKYGGIERVHFYRHDPKFPPGRYGRQLRPDERLEAGEKYATVQSSSCVIL